MVFKHNISDLWKFEEFRGSFNFDNFQFLKDLKGKSKQMKKKNFEKIGPKN